MLSNEHIHEKKRSTNKRVISDEEQTSRRRERKKYRRAREYMNVEKKDFMKQQHTETVHTKWGKKWQQLYIHIFIAFRLWYVYWNTGTCAYWLNIKKEGGVYNFNIQREPFCWSNIFIFRFIHCSFGCCGDDLVVFIAL